MGPGLLDDSWLASNALYIAMVEMRVANGNSICLKIAGKQT
jgi:hypothetical protein